MEETNVEPMNDVFGPDFESKTDLYFTSAYKDDRRSRYRRTGKDEARSMLATTRELKNLWLKSSRLRGRKNSNRITTAIKRANNASLIISFAD